MKVYGLVQSQIGSGHFVRMKQIQKGLRDKHHYMNLQHIQGKISHEDMANRIVGQMEMITDYKPDVLLLEGFPFMRYAWYEQHNGIIEILKLAKNMKCQIVSSVRDIAIPFDETRAAFAVEILNQYFDLVLIHGDREFIKLEDSFPYTDLIDVPLEYTGYITDLYKPNTKIQRHGVLVSGAGGAVADLVFDEALELYKQSTNKEPWTFIISDKHPTESVKKFKKYAKTKKDIKIVSDITSREFRKLLVKSRLSISQCGYNTFLDSYITETPTTFIPFTDNGDISADQPMRTKYYDKGDINMDINGVNNTIELLETLCC